MNFAEIDELSTKGIAAVCPPISWVSQVALWQKCACQSRISRFDTWVRKIPWSKKWQPTLVFLPEIAQEQKNLVGYSKWGFKETDMIEWLSTEHKEYGYIVMH